MGTSNSLILLPISELKLLERTCRNCCRNFQSAALETAERGNLDTSREPVDADLVSGAQPRQRNHPATRHPAGKETDRWTGRPLIAAGGEHRIEPDVVGETHAAAGRAGFDRPPDRVDLGGNRRAA